MSAFTTGFPCNPAKTLVSIKPSSASSSSLFISFSLRPNVKHFACKAATLGRQHFNSPCCSQFRNRCYLEVAPDTLMTIFPCVIDVHALLASSNLLGQNKCDWCLINLHVRHLWPKSADDNAIDCIARIPLAIWINMTFWDELAHIAYEHVEKGHQINVFGRLVSDGKQWTYYKVVVRQLNFVGKKKILLLLLPCIMETPIQWEQLGNLTTPVQLIGVLPKNFGKHFLPILSIGGITRKNKKNPKYPDFKHKDAGEALWIEARYNPSWVKSQLEILDSRMQYVQNQDDNGIFKCLNDGF